MILSKTLPLILAASGYVISTPLSTPSPQEGPSDNSPGLSQLQKRGVHRYTYRGGKGMGRYRGNRSRGHRGEDYETDDYGTEDDSDHDDYDDYDSDDDRSHHHRSGNRGRRDGGTRGGRRGGGRDDGRDGGNDGAKDGEKEKRNDGAKDGEREKVMTRMIAMTVTNHKRFDLHHSFIVW
ncbi:hypothetical protein AX774_g8043 [Zancudomyces culisetae]|uniref:Uncharacterized protein n=1 Tax=Zancudomyces culisetae TaxID=1213189 RepID=A0A1R1PC79_ZANCU|nr:hypothetical protein AX774_g8043 [Zancudomyces culisetae]|eukprot:OMH78563.1 hypothetical protein AX774_g8043 [Zancudomyces culisetae]